MRVSIIEGDFGREMLLRLKELEKRAGIRLSRSQKILLSEIGTVEQVLSILLDSPVDVRVRKQVEREGVIEREVILAREGSKDTLIRAVTRIDVHGLPSRVVNDIRSRKFGIGTIISKHGLETFRRIVEVGYDSKRKIVYRIYEILCKGGPRFRVREEIYGGRFRSERAGKR